VYDSAPALVREMMRFWARHRTKRPTLFVKLKTSVVKPLHFYAAPAPGKNFDAAPAAPAPALLYSKAKFFKRN
jgi:hypothetical protein